MNKIAVVFGTSSGLGLEIARSLINQNYIVYGGSRSESPLEHERFIDLEVDITKLNDIKSFFSEVSNDSEVIDILVNAAGFFDLNSVKDTDFESFSQHLETNVLSYFNILKEFEPFIIMGESSIFNLFSISAKSTFVNTLAHSTAENAKKAMLSIFEKEWAKYQLRITNFYLGAVKTPMWGDYQNVEEDKMLSTQDFIYLFNTILNAPEHIKFPDITMIHRDSFIE